MKLHRSFLNWEWFDDDATTRIFLWLLLSANHKPTKWRGRTVDRGQLLTGRKQIAAGTGCSERQVRTALSRLKSTSEVTIESTNRFSIITICNYKRYQRDERLDDQQNDQLCSQQATNKRPTRDQQATTSNNDNNINNDNNNTHTISGDELKRYFDNSESHKLDNRYMLKGELPLLKYPEIWITLSELRNSLELFARKNLDDKQRPFELVRDRVAAWEKDPTKNPQAATCALWLNSWALTKALQEQAAERRATGSNLKTFAQQDEDNFKNTLEKAKARYYNEL